MIIKVFEIVVITIYVIFIAIVVHPAYLLVFAVVGEFSDKLFVRDFIGYFFAALAFYIWYVIFSYYKHLSERDAMPYSTMEMDKNNLVGKV